jgi:VanZ family protein
MQKAWRKKRKYASILFYLLLQLLPLQLFQDHRDSNLEAVGMTMVCCLHQAVPSRFQVTVPVRDICDRGTVVRDRDPGASTEPR